MEEQSTGSEKVVSGSNASGTGNASSGGKGGGGAKVAIIIVVVVLVVLGVGGYFVQRFVVKKAGEKITESLLGGALGGKVDVSSNGDGVSISNENGSIGTGESAKWPADMPSSVPTFSYGKISMSTKVDNSWSVIYESVEADAQSKYVAALKSKGWTENEEVIDMGETKMVSMANGEYKITLIFDSSSSGASITVTTNTADNTVTE